MFKVGDKIAHPMHGAGIIEGIEERSINGVTKDYYVLQMPAGGMVVMLPVETSETIGVRLVVSPEEAERVIKAIPYMETDMDSNWNRRYRDNMERLKSGDIGEVARVVKGLALRDSGRGLSTGERKMLHQAKQILISELVLSQGTDYEAAEARINAAMGL